MVLRGKTKAQHVLFVDGLKHNLLSVNHLCDQGHEVIFTSKGCVVKELDTGKIVIKATKTPDNVYVLEGDNEHCYLRKTEESWLWHKRQGHLSFRQLVKLSKKGAIRDMLNIIPPEDNICKTCQFSQQSRVQFKAKEYSLERPP